MKIVFSSFVTPPIFSSPNKVSGTGFVVDVALNIKFNSIAISDFAVSPNYQTSYDLLAISKTLL